MMEHKIIQIGWILVKRSWPAYVASLLVVVMACSSAPQKRSLASPIAVTVSESEIYVLRSQGDQIELIQCEDYTEFKDAQAAQSCPAREGTEAILIPKSRFKSDLERALSLPEGYTESDKTLVETSRKELPEASVLEEIAKLEKLKEKITWFIQGKGSITGKAEADLVKVEADLENLAVAVALKKDVEAARAQVNARIDKIIEQVVNADRFLEGGGLDNQPFVYHLLQSYIKLARTEHQETQYQAAAAERSVLEEKLGEFVDISDHVRFPKTFWMGSPENEKSRHNDETRHEQVMTKPYEMGAKEVTQGLWCEVMGTNPSKFKEEKYCRNEEGKPKQYDPDCGCLNHPVEYVSWNDIAGADGFFDRLNARMGLTGEDKFRLPTEAEWELAARAGTTTPFNLGENISTNKVNYHGNYPYNSAAKGIYREQTVAVGSLPNANAWGLYDMHGNVWEWVQDWYGNYPQNSPSDYAGLSSGDFRVIRGGSWIYSANRCRSARRNSLRPETRYGSIGLRLVRTK
jgi:formylglycine-generating enzyme